MPSSYSLHIGINNVDPGHYQGWDGKLNCCENDALFFYEVAGKAGFTDRKLMLSSGSQGAAMPTSANLSKFLDQFSSTLKTGDFLFISYSGHGGQIEDFNFDEDDALDETWCLYDRQYIDDELWNYFSKFPKGVRILMISDSCHSGSVAKAIESGPDKQVDGLVDDLHKKMNLVTRNAPKDVTFPTYMAHKDEYYQPTHCPVVEKEDIGASVLLLAACKDEETAAEWDGFGLFTSVIRKVLLNNKDIGSYEDLYGLVQKQTPAIQHPVLFSYGSGIDLFKKEKIFLVDGDKGDFSLFDPEKNTPPPVAAKD